jgi:hypothetical protein
MMFLVATAAAWFVGLGFGEVVGTLLRLAF